MAAGLSIILWDHMRIGQPPKKLKEILVSEFALIDFGLR